MLPFQANADLALEAMLSFRARVGADADQILLSALTATVEQEQGLMWNSMIFLSLNAALPQVRAQAALNLCVLYPARSGDILEGPRFVADLSLDERFGEEQRGSLLAAALHLGDARTSDFLLETWEQSPTPVRAVAANILPSFPHLPYIDFLLDVLESETDEGIYGALAGQLGRFGRLAGKESKFPRMERSFPVWANKSGPFTKVETFSKREVLQRIGLRISRLIETEEGEPVMPTVEQLWYDENSTSAVALEKL
jgi:hypothetical protein